jgi:hypothetical protein
MAHCPIQQLTDLEAVFEVLRQWPGLKEKKTGTFYYKGKGFLHFHIKGDRRWADIREGKDWGEPFDIAFDPDVQVQAAFLKEIERRFQL